MVPLSLSYFYGNEAEQYSFYRIPKVLFTDQRYKGISVEAKVLYGLLLDRMGLSVRNGWLDEDGRVYLYFTLEDAIALTGVGKNKMVKLFQELDVKGGIGLIERKKQGQGRPTRIYVKNFVLPVDTTQAPPPVMPDTSPLDTQGDMPQPYPTPEQEPGRDTPAQTSPFRESALPTRQEVLTSQIGKSALPQTGSLDFPKSNPNKTDKNDTDSSETYPSIPLPPAPPDSPPAGKRQRRRGKMDRMDEMDLYREMIQENIEFDHLVLEHPYDVELLESYVELMVEACCTSRDCVRIGGTDIPVEVARSRFLKLNSEHISYVLDCMSQNTTLVKNIKAYTLTALYNAPVTMSQYYTSLVSHDMAQGFA